MKSDALVNIIKIYFLIVIVIGLIGCESNEPEVEPSKGIGVFSVSDNKRVTFAPGNLYYCRANGAWCFEKQQYYYNTISNLASPVYDKYKNCWFSSIDSLGSQIDLFGWGTGNNPTKTSKDHTQYEDFYEWGNNKIGTDPKGVWYTMMAEEWEYLLYKRPNADSLYAFARIYNAVDGLIIMPDAWTCPDSVKVVLNPIYADVYFSDVNNYYDNWTILEESGCVFLPLAGKRIGLMVDANMYVGGYWVGSYMDEHNAIIFNPTTHKLELSNRSIGYAVRLVREIK
jgi:hypothetical protein